MEIVEGIYRVDEASSNLAHSNVHLVVNGNELLVVDAGTAGNAKKIVAFIQKIGHQPQEVSTIIITHYHMDHAGSAKELKALTGAKVAASTEDAQVIAGEKPYPKPKNLLMRAASIIKPSPVAVDVVLKEGDTIGNLTVISTPGHTAGSIMLLYKQKGVIFAGDTLRNEDGKVSGGPEHFTWDEAKEKESIRKVAALDFDIMLPGHTQPLIGNASGVVKAFVEASNKA
jgi:glyoxylase-like metal-dependent hydrolase (beta-lactamase superfamily II)